MNFKTIISCIPKLNEIQEAGMLRLIKDLEFLGHQVCLWTTEHYDSLDEYILDCASLPTPNKPRFYRYTGWPYLHFKEGELDPKWLKRLPRWLNLKAGSPVKVIRDKKVREATKVFMALKPDFFLCWNPFCCQYGIAADIARKLEIQVITLEWGYLPHTFQLDKHGFLATSEFFNHNLLTTYSAQQRRVFEEKGTVIFDNLKGDSLSLYTQATVEIPEEFKVARELAPRILLLAIDEIDAGAYPPEHPERKGLLPFHRSSFDQAVSIAQTDQKYHVIFKPHPSHNQYPENRKVTPNLAIVNGNPDQLIEWADVIICSGSKMELSALLAGKPLINYAAGLLFGKGCSFEIHQPEELEAVVAQAMIEGINEARLRNFHQVLGYLDEVYLYSFDRTAEKNVQLVYDLFLIH